LAFAIEPPAIEIATDFPGAFGVAAVVIAGQNGLQIHGKITTPEFPLRQIARFDAELKFPIGKSAFDFRSMPQMDKEILQKVQEFLPLAAIEFLAVILFEALENDYLGSAIFACFHAIGKTSQRQAFLGLSLLQCGV
jgi:hypothetical protein